MRVEIIHADSNDPNLPSNIPLFPTSTVIHNGQRGLEIVTPSRSNSRVVQTCRKTFDLVAAYTGLKSLGSIFGPKDGQVLTVKEMRDSSVLKEMNVAMTGMGETVILEEPSFFSIIAEGGLDALKQLEAQYGSEYLHQKGRNGRTILHYACIKLPDRSVPKNDPNRNIIEYLVTSQEHKPLINCPMEGVYAGETAAHILVIKHNLSLLKLLVANGADVISPKATGYFFTPQGRLYYGETILSFAACMGDKPILEFLFDECNVHPMTQDSYGNTALHVLAWQGYYDTDEWDGMHQREEDDRKTGSESQKTRFIPSDAKLGGAWTLILQKVADRNGVCIVAELEDDVDPMRALNHDGLTPFLVAVERGNRHMVHAMIEAIGEVQWAFGRVKCIHYPLTYFDRACMQSHCEDAPQLTALELAVRNQDVNLICGEPLFRSLLEAKWLYYARTIYFMYLFSTILYATLLTLVIILIPKLPPLDTETGQSSPNYISRWEYFTTTEGRWRFGFEIALMAINVARSAERLRSFPRRFWNLTFQSVLKAAYGLMNFNVWTNVLLAAVVIVCRIAGSMRAENVALGFAIIYAWLSVFRFTKASRNLGPLVLIFYQMIQRDLSRFIVIWSMLSVGFSAALYLQMQPPGAVEWEKGNLPGADTTPEGEGGKFRNGVADWSHPWGAVLWIIIGNFGQSSFDDMREALDPHAAILFWLVFSVASIILLMNVLIAMLNQTYSDIIAQSDRNWHLERARTIMSIDNEVLRGSFMPVGFRRHVGGEYYLAFENVASIPQYIERLEERRKGSKGSGSSAVGNSATGSVHTDLSRQSVSKGSQLSQV